MGSPPRERVGRTVQPGVGAPAKEPGVVVNVAVEVSTGVGVLDIVAVSVIERVGVRVNVPVKVSVAVGVLVRVGVKVLVGEWEDVFVKVTVGVAVEVAEEV